MYFSASLTVSFQRSLGCIFSLLPMHLILALPSYVFMTWMLQFRSSKMYPYHKSFSDCPISWSLLYCLLYLFITIHFSTLSYILQSFYGEVEITFPWTTQTYCTREKTQTLSGQPDLIFINYSEWLFIIIYDLSLSHNDMIGAYHY